MPIVFLYHSSSQYLTVVFRLKFKITLTLGDVLAVGSAWPNNKKAEIYNDSSDAWSDVPDYPFSGTESNFNFCSYKKNIDSINQQYTCVSTRRFISTRRTTFSEVGDQAEI